MTTTRFLPWMRTGLAATIPSLAQLDGKPAAVKTELRVLADGTVHTATGPTILMRGPGDVIAFNPAEIKRREPEVGATGAETNYFCSVEFFSPDLPWRYTPLGVDVEGHLQPWLALVVVELGPDVTLSSSRRLAILHVESPRDHLPDLGDAWAWAHVQVATTVDQLDVAAAFAADPSSFSSRLLCPRRLRADTSYTACLVPTFEAGLLAGLGSPGSTSMQAAWSDASVDLPVYDSWVLTAGDRFDFKTLARRIKPAEVPEDVGFRNLDLTDTGVGMTPIKNPATFVGAMHAPTDELKYWANEAERQTFEADVRVRLDTTPADRNPGSGYDPLVHDPVVAPSLYGAPQVGRSSLPAEVSTPTKKAPLKPAPGTAVMKGVGWFEELNVGPHHRSVAGLGAEVIRVDQESLMAAAWEQARPAIDVNRSLNRGRLSEEAAIQSKRKFDVVDDATAVSTASPALVRMRVNGSTAKRIIADGDAPLAYFGSAFRRLGRPSGPLSMPIDLPAGRTPAWAIADAVVQAAKPDGVAPDSPLSIGFRARYLPAGMDVGADLVADGGVFDTPTEHHLPGGLLERSERIELRRRVRATPAVPIAEVRARPVLQRTAVSATGRTASSGDFVIDTITISAYQYEVVRPAVSGRINTSDVATPLVGLDIAATVRTAVQPALAILDSVKSRLAVPSATWNATSIPTRIGLQPRFTDPMYERVRALSVDYLVPGIGSVRNNTLGLLELNAAYVEAFLVGLNHEMSRELRWREYPAALGQTWFQQFFDNVDPDAPQDIEPIEDWPLNEPLGRHFGVAADVDPNRDPGLVLLMKADLLRKYPDVRVYAIPAKIDEESEERVPDENAPAVGPSMVGTLQRSVNFYGFPTLTEQKARGDDDGLGWFFVLEEEPRSMRFGLDSASANRKGKEPKGETWANLEWPNLANEGEDVPMFCPIDTPNSAIEDAEYDGLEWGANAAVMAAITFRRPIQVFMHASAMLPEPGE